MKVTSRMYEGHDDFMRIRQFLMDTYRRNQTYHNWETRRWEGLFYWGLPDSLSIAGQWVRIWENEQGEIVGVVHVEGKRLGNAWLEIHPDYRDLENEMLDWAEGHLICLRDDHTASLDVEVYTYDTFRQTILTRRGYKNTNDYGFLRWRTLDGPIPTVSTPEGYTIRSLVAGIRSDAKRWADVVGAVFPHANPTEEIIAHFQTAPSYRHDLHMVAVSGDGLFGAFAGLTIDEMNKTAIFEPVGTHPEHRRKKLAQAVMCEGMQRLKRLDIETVYVGTGDMIAANRLYESLGFTDYHRVYSWQKVFSPM